MLINKKRSYIKFNYSRTKESGLTGPFFKGTWNWNLMVADVIRILKEDTFSSKEEDAMHKLGHPNICQTFTQ
jgi:hypothetical protein